jgi:4-amino-4-deoxy-L-arabinose transferase-like glycosyltransferase
MPRSVPVLSLKDDRLSIDPLSISAALTIASLWRVSRAPAGRRRRIAISYTSPMNPRIRALGLVTVVMAMAALYTVRLNDVPSFLSSDETAFALQAHAIATTAHDQNGRLLPLYFQMMQNVWFHPALVYVMAPFLAVLRPMPWAVRLPIAIVSLCNILLVFVVARRLGASDAAAIGASVLLGLTPTHLLHGRFACDYLLPVPCVLVWFILLVDADRSDTSWRFFAAGAALGLGLYTYIAAVVLMPVFLALTYLTLFLKGVRRVRPYAAVMAGFIVLVLPLATYLIAIPQVYAGLAERYGGANVDIVNHPRALFDAGIMVQRWKTYRSFFEWSFLFDRAETHVMSSTYTTGVFLKVMKVLIPIGTYHILRNRRTAFTLLLLAAFLAAPLAASLVPEPYAIDRALLLLPMAALIAGFGVDWLLAPRIWFAAWTARAVCVGLFVWTVVQFNGFYRDYLTAYPLRASSWFDGNHPGAFEPIVREHPRDDRRLIYLSDGLPRIREHWKLYLLGHGRKDLLGRTVFFAQDLGLSGVAPGSVLLTGTDDPVERSFLKMDIVRPVAHITEPDGAPAFTIFERTQAQSFYRFDGTYAAQVSLACAPGGVHDGCASLPTTAQCPSMETVTVANNLVFDTCGYLNQTAITDDGRYVGTSRSQGLPITGTFATAGTFRLSGRGASGGNQYQLTFLLTKRP